MGARYCFHKTFLRALNKDVANYHTLAYSSILISSATELPLLTITSTLHARSISLAFALFKVGLPSPNWNYLNDLGIYSRHVLQAGTLTGYDCHISGIKKAHLSMSFLSVVRLTYTSHHYTMNLTLPLYKVKY